METRITSYPPPFPPSRRNPSTVSKASMSRGKEMNTIKATTLMSRRYLGSKKNSTLLCFSSSGGGGGGSTPEPSSPSDGDKSRQELLAKIAMLQTQKVRLTDYLDERSAYLSKFGEDANTEFDAIGENALKELEDASSRIMDKLENRMQAFEETAETNRQEIEMNEKEVEDFEDEMERGRNEGLFFQNLREKPLSQGKVDEAKVEAQKLREVTRKSAGLQMRRNIYLGLMCLLVLTIGNAVVSSPEVEWRKIGALGLIFMGLLAQLIFEQTMLSTNEKREKDLTEGK